MLGVKILTELVSNLLTRQLWTPGTTKPYTTALQGELRFIRRAINVLALYNMSTRHRYVLRYITAYLILRILGTSLKRRTVAHHCCLHGGRTMWDQFASMHVLHLGLRPAMGTRMSTKIMQTSVDVEHVTVPLFAVNKSTLLC